MAGRTRLAWRWLSVDGKLRKKLKKDKLAVPFAAEGLDGVVIRECEEAPTCEPSWVRPY